MLLCFHPLTLLLALAIALVLEWCVGEPARCHPLVGFGRWVKRIEQQFNIGRMGIALGAFSVLILLAIPIVCFLAVEQIITQLTDHHAVLQLTLVALLHGLALWFALGANSLFRHVDAIAKPLIAQDLPAARYALSMIVSRDCTQLSEADIAKGAIESTLENGADAIFSTLFWFVLLGGAGAIVHRLANTLDAMWGYRTERLIYFGRCAARLDDVLNYIPARLTAASYAALGDTRLAWQAWREQAPLWDSPNAGPVMAAGAGALSLTLGGNAVYHGQIEARTWLGFGPVPAAADIERSLVLVKKTLALWLLSLIALLFIALAMNQ